LQNKQKSCDAEQLGPCPCVVSPCVGSKAYAPATVSGCCDMAFLRGHALAGNTMELPISRSCSVALCVR